MARHFHEELQSLKAKLLQMGMLVEEAIEKSVEALLERNPRLARDVMEEEKTINQFEIDIDDKGHALLALDQPMAADLRFITAILKINNDLERMGDHAVNIAERALILIKEPPLKRNLQLSEMAGATLKMLAESIDAFMNSNNELARSVLKQDDEIDAYNDSLFSKVEELMQKDYSFVTIGMNLVIIGHNFERIADLANNIAEDVIYMKEGKEVRHHVTS